jgi:hypothetical protein
VLEAPAADRTGARVAPASALQPHMPPRRSGCLSPRTRYEGARAALPRRRATGLGSDEPAVASKILRMAQERETPAGLECLGQRQSAYGSPRAGAIIRFLLVKHRLNVDLYADLLAGQQATALEDHVPG